MANVIGDIIASMKKPVQPSVIPSGIKESNLQSSTNSSKKKIWTAFIGIVLLIAGAWLVSRYMNNTKPEAVIDKSIAVLPFTDISDAHDQAYFSDGMMVEILDHLFKIPGLRIIPRNSTLAYKDSKKSLKEIAQELSVVNLLQGSVRKSGNRVKISVQLINGLTEQYLWQQTYDRDLADVFAVQSDVASQIATALKAQITPEVKNQMKAIPTKNQEAYDLYLKGMEESNKVWIALDINPVREGIGYLKSAIALDSTFSDAYTALGECYWLLAHLDPDYTPQYWILSKQYLTKAIALDPFSGWAYSELAVVQQIWDHDRTGARRSFKKATQLTPSNPNIYNDLLWFYMRTMDCDSMRLTVEHIKSLKSEYFNYGFIVLSNICSRNLDSLNLLRPPDELNGFDVWAESSRLLILKRYDEALKLSENSKANVPVGLYVEMLGSSLALSGKKLEARKLIQENEARLKSLNQLSYIGVIYMALGEEDKAYEYLEKALQERDLGIHFLPYCAAFYYKNDNPRFKAFMARTWVN